MNELLALELEHPPETETLAEREPDLSTVLVSLFKGVIYREDQERLWSTLDRLQVRVREYVDVLGLELLLDEAEGYAFLRARPLMDESEALKIPKLFVRRPLSFRVSLLLALLRKKLAEFDVTGGDTRLILTRDELFDMVRVFLPQNTNESRQVDQLDAQINKIIELGFLRRLRAHASGGGTFEVRRILKAYVDAQWMGELDQRLEAYRQHLQGGEPPGEEADEA